MKNSGLKNLKGKLKEAINEAGGVMEILSTGGMSFIFKPSKSNKPNKPKQG